MSHNSWYVAASCREYCTLGRGCYASRYCVATAATASTYDSRGEFASGGEADSCTAARVSTDSTSATDKCTEETPIASAFVGTPACATDYTPSVDSQLCIAGSLSGTFTCPVDSRIAGSASIDAVPATQNCTEGTSFASDSTCTPACATGSAPCSNNLTCIAGSFNVAFTCSAGHCSAASASTVASSATQKCSEGTPINQRLHVHARVSHRRAMPARLIMIP